jgi:hypothetical protein
MRSFPTPNGVNRPSPDKATVQEVLRAVGHAIWELQSLEDVLASYLVMRHDLEPDCTKAELEAALERRRAMTFGQLLRQPPLLDSLSPEIRTRLDSLKNERNWLVHGSRRSLHVSLYTSQTGDATLARLATLAELIGGLRNEVAEALMVYLQSRGKHPSPTRVNAILSEWAQGRRHPGEIGEA